MIGKPMADIGLRGLRDPHRAAMKPPDRQPGRRGEMTLVRMILIGVAMLLPAGCVSSPLFPGSSGSSSS